jgi:hypothetical protein
MQLGEHIRSNPAEERVHHVSVKFSSEPTLLLILHRAGANFFNRHRELQDASITVMLEASSPEPAKESLRQMGVSAPKSEGNVQIAQSPTAKLAEKRPLWMWIGGGVLVVLALIKAIPWVVTAVKTVSTDDAYVNGHVTFVAPRVAGQVVHVLVDDNNRVRKGNVLVQLDKEPYRVRVDIAKAGLAVAQADLVAAQAKVRGLAGLARS